MSQSSFLSPENGTAPHGKRVQVLLPLPLPRAYDYAVPNGMDLQPGDYVRVPFGKKEIAGVVWSLDADHSLPASKVKVISEKYPTAPMSEAGRQFVDWVARYTMADPGSVLKMALSMPEALPAPKLETVYTLSGKADGKVTAQRQRVLDVLQDGTARGASDLAAEAGCTPAVIRAMAEAGWLNAIERVPEKYTADIRMSDAGVSFSDNQQAAADYLRQAVAERKFSTTLLDGVTGSGKTEVYFDAVAEALKQGRQALILLPEISLSAQFINRFKRRFGIEPAIWHSDVTPAKRRDIWAGVAAGRIPVVAGARSALFLPFADLGAIIVDEEHEASYKQEEGVMYHARDMSIVRAHLGAAPVILVSATPSLETMANAQSGKYGYLHLPGRHAGATLPEMKIIDLKKDQPERQRFLAPSLVAALKTTLAAGEQSLLFLNRRGYAPLTLCRTCGYRFQCPSCSAWLVEHKKKKNLQCHHCGHCQIVPRDCPSCHDDQGFAACGPGVERIEEEVRHYLPEARTMILASDIMTTAVALEKAIASIENGEVDVIVGTQMIAKGHHFPDLTLVGVVDADLGLAGGDLRAGERTFQLLHQVAGRAGRGAKPGQVFLQTFMPEQSVIRALAGHDRDVFLAAETKERERAQMPPFGRLAGVIISGPDETKLDLFCRSLAQRAPRYDDVRVLGPAPAPLAFLRGNHRRRFLIKTTRDVAIQKYIDGWLDGVQVPSTMQLKVDIDPQSFF